MITQGTTRPAALAPAAQSSRVQGDLSEELAFALDLVLNKMNVPGLSGQRAYASEVLDRYNAAHPAPSAAPAPAVPDRISKKWLHNIAQDAGFNLNMRGELVVPSPHHDAEPYLRKFAKLIGAAPAQVVQGEPVAWMDPNEGCVMDAFLWQKDAANPRYMVPVFAAPVPPSRPDLRELIADDSYAMTFQSMGQYRTALLKAISNQASAQEGCNHG